MQPYDVGATMSWFYLLLVSASKLGWPVGLKLASIAEAEHNTTAYMLWIAMSVTTMITSMIFLYLAQKEIPMATAYVLWSGIGGMGLSVSH